MPNRVLRDELITSERWWSVSPEASRLWVSIFLSCDDLGRCPGSAFTVRTKYMAGTCNSERCEKLVAELMDVDLIRVYQVEAVRYFFVPRFRQFVRYTRSKYPAPPNEINDINENKQFSSTAQATLKRPEVKRREVKRSEEKQNKAQNPGAKAPFVLPDGIDQGLWNDFLEMRRKIRKPATERAMWLLTGKLFNLEKQGHDIRHVLQQSIRNCWQDLFPLRPETMK